MDIVILWLLQETPRQYREFGKSYAINVGGERHIVPMVRSTFYWYIKQFMDLGWIGQDKEKRYEVLNSDAVNDYLAIRLRDVPGFLDNFDFILKEKKDYEKKSKQIKRMGA